MYKPKVATVIAVFRQKMKGQAAEDTGKAITGPTMTYDDWRRWFIEKYVEVRDVERRMSELKDWRQTSTISEFMNRLNHE